VKKPQAIPELQALASIFVGDGKSPNLFFVSVEGVTVTVTRNFGTAYREWQRHAKPINQECDLEDRQYGVIASVEPDSDEKKAKLRLIDNSEHFLGLNKQYRKELD